MRPQTPFKLAVPLLLAGLAGCASDNADSPGSMSLAPEPATAAVAARPPPYVLTEADRKLSCQKITGSMQVKILQLRGLDKRPQPSAVAKTAHQTVNPVIGAGTAGADPAAERVRERSRLDALNGLLAEKKCKTFNIEADLKGTGTPAPVDPVAVATRKK